ncbi:MAG TPA: class I tRNA ligase family protein, partial [Steroidobacteraceae bacterium]
VYLHGLIRDADGQKMSKSKGNVIDPLDIIDGIELPALLAKRTTGLMQPHLAASIEKATRRQYPEGIPAYGTDALRFTFASLATQSRELRFDLARVGGYRNFCNKLWNGARFVMRASGGGDAVPVAVSPRHAPAAVADRWIRSRLGATIAAVDAAFRDYRFDFAATALYEFTWYEFCDWYLEIVKPVLQGADTPAARQARATLLAVLEALLRLLHPLMPFITEEIWQRVAPLAGLPGPSIMVAAWPDTADFPADAAAEEELAWVRQAVLGIRQIRGAMDIAPARRLPLLLQHAGARDLALLERHDSMLSHLAGLASLRVLREGETPPPAAAAMMGELALLVPMAGLIEPAKELQRLHKRAQKIEQELIKSRGKLANDDFVRNAPPEVVAQERARLLDFERERAGLAGLIDQVRALEAGRRDRGDDRDEALA